MCGIVFFFPLTREEILKNVVAKKKRIALCAAAVLGILAAAGVSRQNRPHLSDVALANIEALADAEWVKGCDNTTPGVCWNEETIIFPYGFTGLACIFTNNPDVSCTGNYIDPTTGYLH